MAGPLQVGDIISLGRLAWEIYRFGWTEDHNASKCSKFDVFVISRLLCLAGFPRRALSAERQPAQITICAC